MNKKAREKRKKHIRKKMSGVGDKPRVYVFKSNRHISVGLADDSQGMVITSLQGNRSVKFAKSLGEKFAKVLKKKKVKKVFFDRSGYKYHGMVSAIAEGLKSEGIKI